MPELTHLNNLQTTPHAEVFDNQNPRTVRLHLEAGQEVPPHRHPNSNIVLHLLAGQLELRLGDDQYELSEGNLIRFSGDQNISPLAIEESTAIIVFAPTEET